MDSAQSLEKIRLMRIDESASVTGADLSGVAETKIEPLMDQRVFVVIGTEDGVAGMEGFIKAAEQIAAEEAEWKKAQDKAKEDAVRKVKEAQMLAEETAKATRDALREQLEAAEEGIERKRRLMDDRKDELSNELVEKLRILEHKVNEGKKQGPTSAEYLEAKAEYDAQIRTTERVLGEVNAMNSAQLLRLQSDLIDLTAKLRAADAKVKK
jgi:hypothetical protein